jgi:hypothetical protein
MESSDGCSGQHRDPVSLYVLRMEAIYFSFFAMKQRLYSDHWNKNAVMLYCSILLQAIENTTRRRNTHMCTARTIYYELSIDAEGQQFPVPSPTTLTLDDDHFGRNM